MYHYEKSTLKNLEIFERKKMGLFEKVTRKSNAPSSKKIFFFKWLKGLMPLVQRLFAFEKFSLFLGKIWKSWIFFEFKKKKKYMNKVHQMLHGFLEFKET